MKDLGEPKEVVLVKVGLVIQEELWPGDLLELEGWKTTDRGERSMCDDGNEVIIGSP
jgi:hypothetical protein